MTEAILIKRKKKRDHRHIYDDLNTKLRDIYTVADLLSEVDSDNIGCDQINATGYCLTRMITEAQSLSKEHFKLWQEGAK